MYYEIDLIWNFLWGFPGETVEDYDQQAELIPAIVHLEPPDVGGMRIWMERFSPIYFDREAFPAKNIRPELSYFYVYPERFDMEKVAYFFDYELENTCRIRLTVRFASPSMSGINFGSVRMASVHF